MDLLTKTLMLKSIITVLQDPKLDKSNYHPVVQGYLAYAVNLFAKATELSIIWDKKRKLQAVSLNVLACIPDMLDLYHQNKETLSPLLLAGAESDDIRFLKTVHCLLDRVNKGGNLSKQQQELLLLFFQQWQKALPRYHYYTFEPDLDVLSQLYIQMV